MWLCLAALKILVPDESRWVQPRSPSFPRETMVLFLLLAHRELAGSREREKKRVPCCIPLECVCGLFKKQKGQCRYSMSKKALEKTQMLPVKFPGLDSRPGMRLCNQDG